MSFLKEAAPIVAALICGAIAWCGVLWLIPVSLIPIFIFANARRRINAFMIMAAYYSGASWSLVPAVHSFFGESANISEGLALNLLSSSLLALPWTLTFTADRRRLPATIFAGLLLTAVPPLGIIGWASPLLSAGVLLPGTKFLGFTLFVGLVCLIGLTRGSLGKAISCMLFLLFIPALYANLYYTLPWDTEWPFGPKPAMPTFASWKAINTHFGGVGPGSLDPITEFSNHQWIQSQIVSSPEKVLLFPENVVSNWNESTDFFWESALQHLTDNRQTLIIGVGISPTSNLNDNKELLAAKHKLEYINGVLAITPAGRRFYQQRIPVPIGMYDPFRTDRVPLNLFGPGTLQVQGRTIGVLLCYEQLVVWPMLTAAIHSPSGYIGLASDYWAKHTVIIPVQQASAQAWGRLFGVPFLGATNR